MSGSDQAAAILSQVPQTSGLTLGGALDTMGKLASNQNQLLQNVDLNRNLQAKQAYAQALTSALNPDGSMDIGKLKDMAQSNPALSYALSSLLPQDQGQNISAQELHGKFAQNAIVRANTIAGVLQNLQRENPNGYTEDQLNEALKPVDAEYGDDPIYAGERARIAADTQDLQPMTRMTYANSFAKSTIDAATQMQAQIAASGQFLNTGGSLDQLGLKPNSDTLAPTGNVVPATLTPGEQTSQVNFVSPGGVGADGKPLPPAGTQMVTTGAAWAAARGLANLLPSGSYQVAGASPANTQAPPHVGAPQFNPANPTSVAAAVGQPQNTPPTPSGVPGGIETSLPPNEAAVVGGEAKAVADTTQQLTGGLADAGQALNLSQEAVSLSQAINSGPGTPERLALAQALQRGTYGALPEKMVQAIVGGSDPNASPEQRKDGEAAAQDLSKLVYNQVSQQYQTLTGQSMEALDKISGGTPDMSKLPEVFAFMNKQLNNAVQFHTEEVNFVDNYARSGQGGNPITAFNKYAKDTGLTPTNMDSWRQQNTINGQSINTLLANPSTPSAQALANALRAHPGQPATLTSTGQQVMFDPTYNAFVVVQGAK